MTLDPKGATGAPDGGDAAKAATGTAAATDPNAEEVERLRAALEQSKAEKETLEQTKRELAATQARLAQVEQSGQPPTTAVPANRYQKVMLELQQAEATYQPGDIYAQDFIERKRAELASIQWQEISRSQLPKIEALADAKLKAKARELWATGRFLLAEDAIAAAEGEVARESRNVSAAEQARRKAADEAAARLAESKPDTGGGMGGDSPAATKKKVLTGSEFSKLTEANTPEARKLWEQHDAGAVEVDWTR